MTLLNIIKTLLISIVSLLVIISCATSAQVENTAPLLKASKVDWRPTSREGPPMTVEFSLVYDAVQQQIIAFGGCDKNFSLVNETWAYGSISLLGRVFQFAF